MKTFLLSKHPTLRLALGAVTISFSGVWVKLSEVQPMTSAFYRVFFGLLFLLLFAMMQRARIFPHPKQLILGCGCGLFFALDLYCWHRSIGLVGPGLATLLGNFQVFLLAFVGIVFLGERYSKKLLAAIPLAMAGLYLIIGSDWNTMAPGFRSGVGFGLATALFYAAYILVLKLISRDTSSPYLPMVLVSFTTALILGSTIVFTGGSFTIPTASSLFSLTSLALFSQCFGWLCIATSLPRIHTSLAGLILLLQPSLAFIWDVLLFQRATTLLNWTGVIITLLAIFLSMITKR